MKLFELISVTNGFFSETR